MISVYTLTNPGGRPYNEDRLAVLQEDDRWCCILADGLGGMGGGAEAAECVVQTLQDCFQSGQMQEDTLRDCVQQAHAALRQLQKEARRPGTMFSTVALLYGTPEKLSWTHSGDSRLYLFKNGNLCSRTRDHSVPQMLASCGEITEEEIRFHPDRNRLLACLGAEDAEVRCSPVSSAAVEPGLSALLCSDGFWAPVSEKEMLSTLERSGDVRQWIQEMADIIGEQPQKEDLDNYSAVGVWVR